MGAKPKAMEEIRSVIRLHKDGFSNYAISEHTGISLPTKQNNCLENTCRNYPIF